MSPKSIVNLIRGGGTVLISYKVIRQFLIASFLFSFFRGQTG